MLISGFDHIFFFLTACRLDIQNDGEWLEANLGPFAKEVDYSALKELNITGVRDHFVLLSNFPSPPHPVKLSAILRFICGHLDVVVLFFQTKKILPLQLATLESLSPDQKAELVLDPSTGALENVTVVTEVFTSVTASPEEGQLDDFFQAFVTFTIQVSVVQAKSNLSTFHNTPGSTVANGIQ